VTSDPLLLRLRVAAGWLIRYNELREIDPEKLAPGDPAWVYMNQDLLQVENRDEQMLIDVGWYPDNDPAGTFAIKVVVEEDWQRPIATARTRSLGELADRLEMLLLKPPQIPTERLVERLVGGTAESRCAAAEALAQRRAIEALDAISAAMKAEPAGGGYQRLAEARDVLIREHVRRETMQ
jgi:hypothetical protein